MFHFVKELDNCGLLESRSPKKIGCPPPIETGRLGAGESRPKTFCMVSQAAMNRRRSSLRAMMFDISWWIMRVVSRLITALASEYMEAWRRPSSKRARVQTAGQSESPEARSRNAQCSDDRRRSWRYFGVQNSPILSGTLSSKVTNTMTEMRSGSSALGPRKLGETTEVH